ncbi:hypothetical protein [Clavibacter zhangzhiyongii]|uniref:hypothetical protein n=1 Tax=Clavibacter zhangzhiyongii TaxID=2768071 RepID=UPI001F33533D|nr:hypothetical protein [Clavibacter zhangzhiyongii]
MVLALLAVLSLVLCAVGARIVDGRSGRSGRVGRSGGASDALVASVAPVAAAPVAAGRGIR